MREIKFRGQRIDTKEWVYGDLIRNSIIDPFTYIAFGVGYKVNNPEIGKSIKVYPHTVGQFTGLKDKNGNDIYEGDILARTTIPDRYIEFIYGGFQTSKINNPSIFTHMLIDEFDVIIGNIHDNPELIK